MNCGKWLDYLYPPRCPVCGRIQCGWHLCRRAERNFLLMTEAFLYEMREAAGGQQRREYCRDCSRRRHAFVRAKSCAAVLSWSGKIVAVSDEIWQIGENMQRVYGQGPWQHRLGPWIRQVQGIRADHTGSAASVDENGNADIIRQQWIAKGISGGNCIFRWMNAHFVPGAADKTAEKTE